MLIFPDKRLTFLATPKTGTTAIEEAVKSRAQIVFQGPRKHMNARRFAAKIAPFLKDTFNAETETVAVMRDPVEQLRSWYRYRARPALIGRPRSTAAMTFDTFVTAAVSDDPPEFANVGSQFQFVTDGSGSILVDHLFSYDNQAGLLDFLEQRLGMKINLDQHNVSPQLDAPLSGTAEALLRSRRAAEFSLFDRLQNASGYLSSARDHDTLS